MLLEGCYRRIGSPGGCVCIPKEEGYKMAYELYQEQPCGYTRSSVWQSLASVRPALQSCFSGCACLMEAEAKRLGYTSLCQGQKTVCGYDSRKNPQYCFAKPAETAQRKPGKIVIDPASDRLLLLSPSARATRQDRGTR